VKVTENYRENQVLGIHFGCKYPLHHMLALFSSSRTRPDSEDVRIDAQDLAFLLATHGFDAVPKDSCAIVKLDKTIYMMMPNGAKPGLADILVMD
jgi:hypothetical protein